MKVRIKTFALLLLVVLLAVIGKPISHLIYSVAQDENQVDALPPGYVDDASRLNKTRVAEIWDIPVAEDHPEQQLAQLLRRAKQQSLKVSIAGSRHSMGGHTIYPGGIAINTAQWKQMELDQERNILKVQAGATWKDVIAYLDNLGRSVQVMQSNNSFSVGGTLSANAHGWQFGWPPVSSTVESFRLMKADGSIVRCSRNENQELFSLVLGGYGLFGIILDVELRVTNNQRYRLEQYLVPVEAALKTFDKKINNHQDVEMVYARMSIAPENFLEEVILTAFFVDSGGEMPELKQAGFADLRRAVVRGSANSDYGKELRWQAETKLQPLLRGKVFSRNQLLNEGVEVFENRSADTTDIIHEYFVPRGGVTGFVAAMQKLIPQHGANLLNVTVRSINEDKDTFLRYADQAMIAFVMLFVQERSDSGEQKMQRLTQDIIDAALQHGGRYYLPYRLHATSEQFAKAYPQASEFFDLKRKYDPDVLFQNKFYLQYGMR